MTKQPPITFGMDKDIEENISDNEVDAAGTETETNDDNNQTLFERETQWVMRSKRVVLIALSISAIAASFGAYFYALRTEQIEFRSQFQGVAEQVLGISKINSENIFNSFDSLSLQVTNTATVMGSPWPNIIFPSFEELSLQTMHQTRTLWVAMLVFVSQEDRPEYEVFANENLKNMTEGYNAETPLDDIVPPFIFDSFVPDETGAIQPAAEAEIRAPVSQVGPINYFLPFINFDAFGNPAIQVIFDEMFVSKKTLLSEVANLVEAEPEPNGQYNGEWPTSYIFAPVFRQAGNSSSPLVGAIGGQVPWHDIIFRGVLSDDVHGIIFVIRNTCGQRFSYRIDGDIITYLGKGDYHNDSYDSYEVVSGLNSVVSVEKCTFTAHLYPSKALEDSFHTKAPFISAIVVMTVFIFTALVFRGYDFLVERRQKKVLNSANRSGAIVNSLFPMSVRNRLLNETKEPETATRTFMNVRHQSKSFPTSSSISDKETSPSCSKGKPIADLIPNVTVLFADLVGFTKWSANREPSDVFILLEMLYNSFDQIARRLGVFKVETIGDCYMAATGLPTPNKMHAVIMARFARSCLARMGQVMHQLQDELGQDTIELSTRFGIHSGSVTAGVLRGEKSRFQLFGDTVNTASRMESTGLPDRIQISNTTADLLVEAGKRSWITARSEKVSAKGKGEMDTWWLCSGATGNKCISEASTHKSGTDSKYEHDDMGNCHAG